MSKKMMKRGVERCFIEEDKMPSANTEGKEIKGFVCSVFKNCFYFFVLKRTLKICLVSIFVFRKIPKRLLDLV